jgi:hypothetical protein
MEISPPAPRSLKLFFGSHERNFGRLAFLATVVLTGATFWISPRLPMVDLPQHAGQVALWRDLVLGDSKWQALVYINYFTPYLLGYSFAFLLSFIIPVLVAMKLTLTVAFYAFVSVCVLLRRRLDGDPRLDWLFLPWFFGFAYAWGFYTFLIAAPIGVLFICLALRYAQRPTPLQAAILIFAGLTLFFAHGLVFLFANAIGVGFLLVEMPRRSPGRMLRSIIPYGVLALCCMSYALIRFPIEKNSASGFVDIHWGSFLDRLKFLAFFPLGAPKTDPVLAPLRFLFLASPLLLRARVNTLDHAVFVPLALTLLVVALVPLGAANTWFLYQRFDMFIVPFYALVFRRSDGNVEPTPISTILSRVARLWLPALCWIFLAVHAGRLVAFADESAAFDEVLAAAQPEERALTLVFDPASPATRNPFAYFNFPVWYQAEKRGFVDFNAAWFLPQIVRFRSGREPVDTTAAGWRAIDFDWTRAHAENYRYFFVRRVGPLPDAFFPVGRCEPQLLKAADSWSVFENVNCHVPYVPTR